MIILIKLILAHFVGDFILQPKSWVIGKEKLKARSFKIYLHFLIHGLLVLLVLWDLNYWLLVLLLTISHAIIDLIKIYAQKENTKSKWFIIDQLLHFISILGLWIVFFKPEFNYQSLFGHTNFWIYITAILFITFVSGIAIRELLSNWSSKLNNNNDESLINAGKYIGMLERVFIFVFIITGNWEGIGFLLAAKSIFRFGDLKDSKDRNLTEYILIGTLLSFGIAGATALLVLHLVEV